MASKEKIQELFRVLEIDKQDAQIREMMLQTMAADLDKEDISDEERALIEEFNLSMFDKAIETGNDIGMDILSKHFSDEELDEIIKINKNLVMIRCRSILPEVAQRGMNTLNSMLQNGNKKLSIELLKLRSQEYANLSEKILALKNRLFELKRTLGLIN